MSTLQWSPALKLGIDEIDVAHRQLIELMGQLEEESRKGAQKQVILATFQRLGSATVKHFAEEERYMESIGFPGLATHRSIHATLLDQLRKHLQAYQSASAVEVPPQVFSFLSLWLRAHISGIDRKYADFHKVRGARL